MPTRLAVRSSAPFRCCPICLQEFIAPVITACRHSFCEGCIKSAFRIKKECPTCRRAITTHRELRADPQLAILLGSTPKALEVEAASGSTIDGGTIDRWECTQCTLSNSLAAERCIACMSRRPARLTWRPSATLDASCASESESENDSSAGFTSYSSVGECDKDSEEVCSHKHIMRLFTCVAIVCSFNTHFCCR